MTENLWKLLDDLKDLEWIELSHILTNESPFWDGIPKGAVELGTVLVNYDYIEGMPLQIQSFKFPGQFGTHIDYPKHFIENGRNSDDFHIKDTVLPLVVIDVSEKVENNFDYEITLEDIANFEIKHGRIPKNSFVAMRTDWSKRWPDKTLLENVDYNGKEHFPGWTIETLEYLFKEREVAGIGHETLDTDSAITSFDAGDLQAERYVLAQDKFQIEMLTNLDKIPLTGALIFIAAPRVSGANGLPVRAWAIVPSKNKKHK